MRHEKLTDAERRAKALTHSWVRELNDFYANGPMQVWCCKNCSLRTLAADSTPPVLTSFSKVQYVRRKSEDP